MNLLDRYHQSIVSYDFIYKFSNININRLPKIQKIVVVISCHDNLNLKYLISKLIALEILTNQRGFIKFSNSQRLTLKVKKGNFLTFKAVLRKKYMSLFFFRFLFTIFFNLNSYIFLKLGTKQSKFFEFKLFKLFNGTELENYYKILNDLTYFNIVIVANSQLFFELYYLLNSYKLILFKNS